VQAHFVAEIVDVLVVDRNVSAQKLDFLEKYGVARFFRLIKVAKGFFLPRSRNVTKARWSAPDQK
jgi:hypothetical protein